MRTQGWSGWIVVGLLSGLLVACGDDDGSDGGARDGSIDAPRDTAARDTAARDTASDTAADTAGDTSLDASEICATAALDEPCDVEGLFCGGPCTCVPGSGGWGIRPLWSSSHSAAWCTRF